VENVENILANIVREVEAIRGYITNPVDGDFLQDEVEHLYELATALKAELAPDADGDGDNDEDDHADLFEDEEA